MSVGLMIVDPQNCFMDLPGAPLPVKGATADMDRLCAFIEREAKNISEIKISFDTHPRDHISHDQRWVDEHGMHPAPFTIIRFDAYENGSWRAAQTKDQKWQGEYLRLLSRPHCIWPVHGQPNTWEWQMTKSLHSTMMRVKHTNEHLLHTMCIKGIHRDVEQFGIFGADVPYPQAPETEINMDLINRINRHDLVIFAGEASSHCVMDSVNQFIAYTPDRDHRKIVILRDCMSPVPQAPGGPDFPKLAEEWLASLSLIDVTVTTSTEFTL